MRSWRLVGGLMMGLLAGCSSHTSPVVAPRVLSGHPQYVALGSSFAAGPLLQPRDHEGSLLCGRSMKNYAHQLAGLRGLSLRDMSCSGAKTSNILDAGQHGEGPQMRGVTAETELVTVTIGGNDVFLIGNLVADACTQHSTWLRRMAGACTVTPAEKVEAGFAALPAQMGRIADEVHQRAPKARLIFVNYQAIVPPTGTCDRLSLSAADADAMRPVATRLAAITQEAARSHGAEVLDVAEMSQDHNVCSADPWIAGAYPPKMTAALHPNIEGMTAIAAGLNRMLGAAAK
jgi:lysophospholipase L1-like esterase